LFRKSSSSSGYRDPEILVGLDLGTSKISVVVAEREGPSGEAQIIGIGQAPSNGIRKGLIVNIDQTVKSLRHAIDDAENMVGLNLTEATVAFSGGDVQSLKTKGMIALGRAPRTVMQFDIERVIESAQANISVPSGKMILHTIPVEYSLDGNSGIDDPLGMNATRLDIELESVIVPVAMVQNVRNCVEKAGLEVSGLVIKPLASALGALTHDESLAGTAVVDIGGGTCGVAVFVEGRPKHLAVISVGGDHVTNDVATLLKIPINRAEEIKKEVNLFWDPQNGGPEDFNFEHMGRNYSYSMSELTDIVQCRIEELFSMLIKAEIAASGASMLPGGLVITGGGSKSAGLDHYLARVMNMPVRVSLPLDSGRMPPARNGSEYTCAAGIIRYVLEQERNPYRFIGNSFDANPIMSSSAEQGWEKGAGSPKSGHVSFWQSIMNLFKELF
jgi:cell division protein FtsA